jgi:hypothetical protein
MIIKLISPKPVYMIQCVLLEIPITTINIPITIPINDNSDVISNVDVVGGSVFCLFKWLNVAPTE